MMEMTPQYNTMIFTDVWETEESFLEDYNDSPIPQKLTDEVAKNIFWLLYAKYGNNAIANYDLFQWKTKVFSVIFQYGPTWAKRIEIQDKLRNLTEDELRSGSKQIMNHAYNPSAEPSTATTEEIDYINEQNTSKNQRGVVEAYSILWDMLSSDVTEQFMSKFLRLFKLVVKPENPLLYVEGGEDDGYNY